uniref:Isoleucine--tRNA ligase n=1 Tax=candidate division WWE3 bacterium TaxID=2053526 RepID=A0A831YZH1_UNCKA
MAFQKVELRPDFPARERKILEEWYSSGLVKKYLEKNQNSKKLFRFLDGPITANNPMGVHHAWGRTYKDLFQRYRNMRGFRQRFQNGFDAQGLWVEVEVEKELGFKSKKDIERYGVAKFVNKCKERVFKYAKIQTAQSKRLGYFMDWGRDYFTLSDENNFMIWHFLKKCHEHGWIYEGRDVVPWCIRCGTALSEHEIATEGYKELTHLGIFLKFPVAGKPRTFFLVWTTTPWTLPANTSLAVGKDLRYAWVEEGEETFILAKDRLAYAGLKGELVGEEDGENLVGWRFAPLFPDLPAQKGVLHEVVAADFVTLEEGTGIVHVAPGSGKEDYLLAKKENLPVIASLDEEGKFLANFGRYSGRPAAESGRDILAELKNRGLLFKTESYTHRYPVCWRCGTELIFRLVDEWYIAMGDLRSRMMRITKSINWIPSFGRERELDWLKNMGDWLISKKRYWGLALPFWKCQKCGHLEVIGSKEELKEKSVSGWAEFSGHSPHRPWVDKVQIRCPECGESVSRIKDVGNPWLDAGIVPFSTLVDPKTKKVSYLTDKKYWREWFPFDFITESFPGQFRNWFYSLLAMAAVLEDKAPFKNVLGHALVRDERGREMHKSWGNAIEFNEGAEKMGADIMRWLYLTHDPDKNINFGYGPAETIRRRFFLIFWNVYRFLVDYANAEGWEFPKKPLALSHKPLAILDRWVLSKLNSLIKLVTDSLDRYDPATAANAIERFIVDDLSQWYLRRSRSRVGPTAPDVKDKQVFYRVMGEVLATVSRLLAPFTPFISEEIYGNLTGGSSVHLSDWPTVGRVNLRLEAEMRKLREIVELGHSFRKTAGIPLRQPLSKLTVSGSSLATSRPPLVALLADELNVKEIEFCSGKELKIEFDTKPTPELKAEYAAREMIRAIQELRREKNLKLTDRIKVTYPATGENKAAVALFSQTIRRETLAAGLAPGKELRISRVVKS